MKAEAVQMQRATLTTRGGCAVHMTVERNGDGEPERLELCEGWTEGGRDRHQAVQVPEHVLAELHALLGAFRDMDVGYFVQDVAPFVRASLEEGGER